MTNLDQKIKKSRVVIENAAKMFSSDKLVIAWTGGKDSTLLLHLMKTVFDNKVPFPVMFNDSTMEFKAVYRFIKKIVKVWQLNLIIVPHDQKELLQFHKTKDLKRKKELSRMMKINAINRFVKKYKVKALMSGIRWDEHPARSKEKYFSSRKDHTRIHPILHFSEIDVWNYIKKFNVPYVSLYKFGYRSLGEKPFTTRAVPGRGERSGRDYNKEQLMEKLRSLGYW